MWKQKFKLFSLSPVLGREGLVWSSSILAQFHTPGDFISVGIYLFKVNNSNTRSRCEIYSKVTITTPEQCEWPIFVQWVIIIFHLVSSWHSKAFKRNKKNIFWYTIIYTMTQWILKFGLTKNTKIQIFWKWNTISSSIIKSHSLVIKGCVITKITF